MRSIARLTATSFEGNKSTGRPGHNARKVEKRCTCGAVLEGDENSMLENANQGYATKSAEANKQQRPENDMTFEPLLDTDEAAKLLRLHPRTLRTKARQGMIPAVQVGKRWRFRISMLNHWLEKIAS